MTIADNLKDGASDARDQIQKLRAQVDELMRDRVSPAVSDAAGRARDYTSAQAEVVSDKVREQPLIAIAIAAGIGYLVGRVTR